MILYLDDDLGRIWQEQDVFRLLVEMEGKIYRQVKGRRTLLFKLEDNGYFLKFHSGVGWKEIFKNLLRFRLPVIGAENEWRAIRLLQEQNIDTLTIAAFGRQGWNPATLQSFLVTRELENTIDLEAYCANWEENPPAFAVKRALIEKVARISRRLHEAGVCHRDYYLCHFHLLSGSELSPGASEPFIYLIDLHRALFGKSLDSRWVKKDIAGLYFSSKDIGLTHRDRLRFARLYRNSSLRNTLAQDNEFWRDVVARGEALYAKLGNPLQAKQ